MTVQPLSPRPSVLDPSQAEDFVSLSTSRGARCAPVPAFQMRSQKRPALLCLFLMYPIDCLIPVAAEIRIPEMAQVETNNKNVIPTVSCVFIITQVGVSGLVLVGPGFQGLKPLMREGFYFKTIRKNTPLMTPSQPSPTWKTGFSTSVYPFWTSPSTPGPQRKPWRWWWTSTPSSFPAHRRSSRGRSDFRYLSEDQTWKKPGFLNLFKTTRLNHIFKLATALISLTCTTALEFYNWDVSRTLDRLMG